MQVITYLNVDVVIGGVNFVKKWDEPFGRLVLRAVKNRFGFVQNLFITKTAAVLHTPGGKTTVEC